MKAFNKTHKTKHLTKLRYRQTNNYTGKCTILKQLSLPCYFFHDIEDKYFEYTYMISKIYLDNYKKKTIMLKNSALGKIKRKSSFKVRKDSNVFI